MKPNFLVQDNQECILIKLTKAAGREGNKINSNKNDKRKFLSLSVGITKNMIPFVQMHLNHRKQIFLSTMILILC